VKKQTRIKCLKHAGLLAGLAIGVSTAQASAVPLVPLGNAAPWILAQAASDEVPIYGSQLMTEQERIDYRARWRAARTDEERAKLRSDHHERMKERARERGVTLPDEPPARGAGAGPRGGMGSGAGGGAGGPGPGPGGGGGSGPGPGSGGPGGPGPGR
jgi:hypothetical protein